MLNFPFNEPTKVITSRQTISLHFDFRRLIQRLPLTFGTNEGGDEYSGKGLGLPLSTLLKVTVALPEIDPNKRSASSPLFQIDSNFDMKPSRSLQG